MRRAKIPKSSQANGTTSQDQKASTNGTSTPTASQSQGQQNGAIAVSKEWTSGPDGLPDIRIPESAVEVGVEFLKEKMRDVVEIVDDDELD